MVESEQFCFPNGGNFCCSPSYFRPPLLLSSVCEESLVHKEDYFEGFMYTKPPYTKLDQCPIEVPIIFADYQQLTSVLN